MGGGIVGKGLDNGFSSSSGNNSGTNSDDDSDNYAGSATKDNSSKEKQSGLLKKLSAMTDTNTSLDLASFSGRMLTIDALAGTLATMSNSTATPASTRSSVGKSVAVDTASSKVLTTKLALKPAATSSSPRGKVLSAKPCSPSAKLLPAKPGQTVHLPCHGPTPTGKVMSAKLISTDVSAGSSSASKVLSTKTSSKRVSMDIASNELPTTTTHFLATPRRLWSARGLSAKKTDRGLGTEQSADTPAHSPAARKIRGMY
ncbi:hypothetical protein DL89DRAFT_269291 [Linderina pennispora]|uniref:Uncharacterized protein n=1 Tax=Linderina pennispora TaxID=61395 RepID=A0A1Y1W2X4_9FUNG|nr:uncharacterized protein DL89DRAFT_269291 [Linderina pennispora]ORX67494.1 hypothetical protein DL89DRAFT_269291 [Linderina pennispora]